jgi:predicted nucleotidyltransferase component of viral defense system
MAADKNVPYEILYQNFFFERFLERLSVSMYKDRLIIKGGFLMTSLLGIDERTTADVDMTMRSITMDDVVIRRVIDQIIDIDVDDGCVFEITNISKTRHDDQYDGSRVTILGMFHSLRFHFKVDLTTGDKITPAPIKKTFTLTVIEKDIELFAYNYETVLAEKLQTILSRGVATTRAKDYFDVYSILIKKDLIDYALLSKAFKETMAHRHTIYRREEITEIMDSIISSSEMNELWNKYQSDYPFARHLKFDLVLSKVQELLLILSEYK